jgi:hypothetical protein
METTINGTKMYVKHVDSFCALLVDDNEREHRIPANDFKALFPSKLKRVNNKSKIK